VISAVIVVHRRSEYLSECIKTMRMSGTDVEITVYNVGNDSAVGKLCLGLFRDKYIDHLIMGDKWPVLVDTYIHALDFVKSQNPDVILLSADDYHYEAGWGADLERFIAGTEGKGLYSCELEPLFPWNCPKAIVERDGVKALERPSIPGANWAFTPELADMVIEPMCKAHAGDWQADLKICEHIRDTLEMKLYALRLADHVGAYNSEVGNMAFQVNAKPLPKKWQI